MPNLALELRRHFVVDILKELKGRSTQALLSLVELVQHMLGRLPRGVLLLGVVPQAPLAQKLAKARDWAVARPQLNLVLGWSCGLGRRGEGGGEGVVLFLSAQQQPCGPSARPYRGRRSSRPRCCGDQCGRSWPPGSEGCTHMKQRKWEGEGGGVK